MLKLKIDSRKQQQQKRNKTNKIKTNKKTPKTKQLKKKAKPNNKRHIQTLPPRNISFNQNHYCGRG